MIKVQSYIEVYLLKRIILIHLKSSVNQQLILLFISNFVYGFHFRHLHYCWKYIILNDSNWLLTVCISYVEQVHSYPCCGLRNASSNECYIGTYKCSLLCPAHPFCFFSATACLRAPALSCRKHQGQVSIFLEWSPKMKATFIFPSGSLHLFLDS